MEDTENAYCMIQGWIFELCEAFWFVLKMAQSWVFDGKKVKLRDKSGTVFVWQFCELTKPFKLEEKPESLIA